MYFSLTSRFRKPLTLSTECLAYEATNFVVFLTIDQLQFTNFITSIALFLKGQILIALLGIFVTLAFVKSYEIFT
jgi:hypothetical protein